MKKEINLLLNGKDQTADIREAVENPEITHVQFVQGESDGRIFLNGVLPMDETLWPRWELGQYGAIRIEGKKGFKLIGKSADDKTVLYNNGSPVTEHEFAQRKKDDYAPAKVIRSNHRIISIRGNNEDINIENLIIESDNTNPLNEDKEGKPLNGGNLEMEHAIEIVDAKKVNLKNVIAKNVWGDGVYIYNSEDINVEDCTADWNGRQGAAVVAGKRIHFKNYQVLNSRRSGIDLEPNNRLNTIEDVVIEGCFFKNHLLGVPMGGSGHVLNVLIKDSTFTYGNIYSKGVAEKTSRGNIIVQNNRNVNGGRYINTNNILIENNIGRNQDLEDFKFMAELTSCTNVTIRNNDYPDSRYILLAGKTTPEDVKVYGNVQNLEFLAGETSAENIVAGKRYYIKKYYQTDFEKLGAIKGEATFKANNESINLTGEGKHGIVYEIMPLVEYVPTEEEKNTLPFEVSEWLSKKYYREVEPTPTPEEPVEEVEEPTPVIPKPTITITEKEPFYKNKKVWIGAGILILIILILIL